MDVVGVGFIGCGRIADLHARGYQGSEEARLVAVCDVDQTTATGAGERWRAGAVYTDHRELLDDPRVDAVEILTPHHLHEPLILEALARGKHVSVQKPMTISLASADRVLAAAARSDRVFRVADNYVFYPPIVRARELITAGAIGEPSTLRIKFTSGTGGWTVPASAWEWRVQERLEGRPFQTFDHGHHLWAVASFLLGGIERVAAWIDTADGMVDSPATVMWKHRGKTAYGTCEYAHAASMNVPSDYYANDESFEITGTDGIIQIARCTGHIVDGPVLRVFDGTSWEAIDSVPSDWAEGFVGSTRNFIAAIKGREPPMLNGAQAREVLRLDLAIQKSARLLRSVYPEELDRQLPDLHALGRRIQDARSNPLRVRRRLPGAGRTARYAPQAAELTRALVTRFDPEAAAGWDTVIGLRLTAEGEVGEQRFGLVVRDGAAELSEGDLPEDAVLVVTVPAGTWAAVLLKRKKLELALVQGRLKLQGRAEEGLRLREVFGL